MAQVEQPKEIAAHSKEYKPQAWQAYNIQELGMWVHLFAKRAEHRTDSEKRRKDLYDARNYLKMIEAHLDKLDAETVQTPAE